MDRFALSGRYAMDISAYDEKTATLIKKVYDHHRDMDRGIFRTLAQLKKTAAASGDDALLGFVYFHHAEACYTLDGSYVRFRRDLAKAVSLLQRANDLEQLLRAYNLVGLDALNNGSLDVAYYYFSMGLQAAKEFGDPYMQSIGNVNIGQVFFDLGNLKRARQYVRLGMRMLTAERSDDHYYYHNLVNCWHSYGLISLLMGDLKNAKRAQKKIDHVMADSGGKGIGLVKIPVLLFHIMIAIEEKDEALYSEHERELFRLLNTWYQPLDFIPDLAQLCMYLIEHERLKPVRRILDTISKQVEDTGVIHMMKLVSQIEIAYYEKKGNEKRLVQHLRRQHELDKKAKNEYHLIYAHSINLIEEMNTIRQERVELIEENDLLQVQAQTDALTGIANRMMMNRLLSNSFERCFAAKCSFGLEILDVDKFKEYNDTYGHQAGDICLQRIAHEIERITRGSGMYCARYGGDEFVIIFEDKTDEEILEIARALEKRVHALNIAHSGARRLGRVSISQGICNSVPRKKNKTWDFLTEADNALYAVKKNLADPDAKDTIRLYHLPEKVL